MVTLKEKYSFFYMKNIFLDESCVTGNQVIIQGDSYHYLRNVRRIKKETRFDAIIGKKRFKLAVKNIANKMIVCEILHQSILTPESTLKINVYQGLLKAGKMDLLVGKLSEMEVENLYPLKTERTVPVKSPGEEKRNRWLRIAREGSKISGSESVMTVHTPFKLGVIAERLHGDEKHHILIFDLATRARNIKEILETFSLIDDTVFHLFFGPEGGFSPKELKLLVMRGGIPVKMGGFVLKSETAAIVGTGFVSIFYANTKSSL
jgi:16S rRNA (uracil1498-N3)-methyltransferase